MSSGKSPIAGAPVVSWTPDLGDERVYTVEGKATLGAVFGGE